MLMLAAAIFLIWAALFHPAAAQSLTVRTLQISVVEQAATHNSYVLPIGLVDGRLVIAADLETEEIKLSAALLIDLTSPHYLALHPDVGEELGTMGGAGPVDLLAADGLKVSLSRELIPGYTGSVDFGRISSLYSEALDNRPLVGSIGIAFLKKFHMSLDVGGGTLTLSPVRGVSSRASDPDAVVKFRRGDAGEILLPVTYGSGKRSYLALSGANFDTYINPNVANGLGVSAGDLGSVYLGAESPSVDFDLSRFVAFRPLLRPGVTGELFGSNSSEQKSILSAGTNLLSNFRVDIDWVNGTAGFTQTQAANFPDEERIYFEAEAYGNADDVEAFLLAYPEGRLVTEAARLLVDRRIVEQGDTTQIIKAARLFRDSVSEDVGGATCLALMQQVAQFWPERTDIVIAVGELGLDVASKDSDPLSIYRIHEALGQQRLAEDDIKGAWKNLMSAAFGMPTNARVNLNLGRVYERQGRLRRAYSRYKRALAAVEATGKQNSEALVPGELLDLKNSEARLREELGL